jgi:hypothetical protein
MKNLLSIFLFDTQGTLSEISGGLSKKVFAKTGWLPLSLYLRLERPTVLFPRAIHLF